MVLTWLHVALLIFLPAGVLFGAGPLLGSVALAPRVRNRSLLEPYECGIPAYGHARVRWGINYFFYALIFLAFDVDVLYLFPAATRFTQDLGWDVVALIGTFIVGLLAAVVYFQRLGVFSWPRQIDV